VDGPLRAITLDASRQAVNLSRTSLAVQDQRGAGGASGVSRPDARRGRDCRRRQQRSTRTTQPHGVPACSLLHRRMAFRLQA